MKAIKTFMAKALFRAFGRMLKCCSRVDCNARKLIEELPVGYTVRFSILGCNALLAFTVVGNGGLVVYKEADVPFAVDLEIRFKSVELALPVLCGLKSVQQAYNERLFQLSGDISHALRIVQLVLLTECYAFPRFMLKKIVPLAPARESSKLKFYGAFMSRL